MSIRADRNDENTCPVGSSVFQRQLRYRSPPPILNIEGSPVPIATDNSLVSNLAIRERYRDEYWQKHDPIADDRLLWRAQAFRHTVHLLPRQTILELGCGEGFFTNALLHVSRGENRITAVTFQKGAQVSSAVGVEVELFATSNLPSSLAGRHFDYVVAMDLLDRSC